MMAKEAGGDDMDIAVTERSVGHLLRQRAERLPDKLFVRCNGVDLSYGEFNRRANQFAAYLFSLGMKPGDKLGIMLPNSPEFLVSWLGAAKANIVYVPINTEYRGPILSHQLDLADVTTLVISGDYLDRLVAISDNVPKIKRVVVHGAAQGAVPLRMTRLDFAEATSTNSCEPDELARHSDPFAISYTSGTTGPSKGALTTNCHVLTFAQDFITLMEYRPDDKLYTCMPLFHALGSWLGVLTTLIAGGQCLVGERFSASRFWDDVRGFDATLGHVIFSMPPILLKQPPRPDDKTTLRRVYVAQRNKEFEERFDCRIQEIYGQSETGIVTGCWPGVPTKPGSAGRANNNTYDVKIVDDDDNEVPPGTVGEFVVRPRNSYGMMNEYYNMPRETIAAFRNFWFHTGDSGRMDEHGYFYFVDRKKDALRRRGQNISSFELESVVMSHPKVLECAAVAVPSPVTEDDVKIVVVARPGQPLDAEELWRYCDENMPRFWVPRYIEFRGVLPRTPTQKVEKYKLRSNENAGAVSDREMSNKAKAG
jgi:crotonobetaine/carnitine-CoA ligase